MPEWLRAAPEWLLAKLERLAIAAGAIHSTDGMPPEEFLEHIPLRDGGLSGEVTARGELTSYQRDPDGPAGDCRPVFASTDERMLMTDRLIGAMPSGLDWPVSLARSSGAPAPGSM
jgi:hypothetical protein